jgi:hypothetical protein
VELKRPFEIMSSVLLLVATVYQAARLNQPSVAPPAVDDRKLFVVLVILTALLGLYTLFDVLHDHHQGADHDG